MYVEVYVCVCVCVLVFHCGWRITECMTSSNNVATIMGFPGHFWKSWKPVPLQRMIDQYVQLTDSLLGLQEENVMLKELRHLHSCLPWCVCV